MNDDKPLEGFRVPGRVQNEAELEMVMVDAPTPAIDRLTNRFLIDASRVEGSLLRLDSSTLSTVELKRPGERWETIASPSPDIAARVARRLKKMAGFPSEPLGEKAMGFIRLRLSRDVDFCLHVRPNGDHERVIVRLVPDADRAMLFPDPPALPEALALLQEPAEHAFRLAGGDSPESAIEPLRALLRESAPLGASSVGITMGCGRLLGQVLTKQGDLDGALAAYTSAREAARSYIGEGPAYAEISAEFAEFLRGLGEHERALAMLEEGLAIARRLLVDDPNVAEHLYDLALALRAAGREPEAIARFDEAIEYLTELSGADDDDVAAYLAARDAAR